MITGAVGIALQYNLLNFLGPPAARFVLACPQSHNPPSGHDNKAVRKPVR